MDGYVELLCCSVTHLVDVIIIHFRRRIDMWQATIVIFENILRC